jgi:hypothetical protein
VPITTSACTTPSGLTTPSCEGGYAKPTWQTGTGVPTDGKRDIPDVSLFAANGALGSAYVICDSDSAPCDYALGSDAVAQAVGGTSVASPAMAGIMALVNQKMGSPQGNVNAALYTLASLDTRARLGAELASRRGFGAGEGDESEPGEHRALLRSTHGRGAQRHWLVPSQSGGRSGPRGRGARCGVHRGELAPGGRSFLSKPCSRW